MTRHGPLKGNVKHGVTEYLGVPFAAAPVGALRWAPPQPAPAWEMPRDATRRGPACAQPVTNFPRELSEDCLTLNLWVPAGDHLPVMVWIPGGAFVGGSGGDDLYDGARLAAATGNIVITLNYRLGAFGFLSLREVAAEQHVDVAPAAGFLDQRAALQWVHDEISAFHGEPSNVTVFGESAGAWSICSHLVSPKSRGLFARAIMQSGACSDALYFDAARAQQQGDALTAAVGCTGPGALECLRGKSAEQLASALPYRRGMLLEPGVWWGPIVDGVELPKVPLGLIRSGDWARVPLMTGFAENEGTLHTMSYEAVTPAELVWFARDVFGEPAGLRVPQQYARDTPKTSLTDVVSDGIFACNTRRVARALAAQQVPVWVYELTRGLDNPVAHKLGATHSVDLFFLFGNESLGVGLSDAEQPLSSTMMQAWGRFARSGNPGSAELAWPGYTVENDALLQLNDVPRVVSKRRRAECDFWDTLSPP